MKISSVLTTIQRFLPLILAMFVVATVYKCTKEVQERTRIEKNYDALQSEVKYTKDKLGQEVATRKAVEARNDEIKEQLWIKDDSLSTMIAKYKEAKATVKTVTVFRVDTVKIPFENPVDYEFNRDWQKLNLHYKISGVATNLGITINELELKNTQRVVIGVERGFFKTQYSASVTNSNPYIKTTDLESQILTESVKRWGIGIFGGIDFTGQPTFGAGISYNLIRF